MTPAANKLHKTLLKFQSLISGKLNLNTLFFFLVRHMEWHHQGGSEDSEARHYVA